MKVWSGWISGVKSEGLITRVSLLSVCQCQCRSTSGIFSEPSWLSIFMANYLFNLALISAHSMMNLVAK
jgi:hypothetical protein